MSIESSNQLKSKPKIFISNEFVNSNIRMGSKVQTPIKNDIADLSCKIK